MRGLTRLSRTRYYNAYYNGCSACRGKVALCFDEELEARLHSRADARE